MNYVIYTSKCLDPNTRLWSFALKDYQAVQDRVGTLKPEVVMGVIPKSVINLCQRPSPTVDRSCLNSIEPLLAQKLMPFQQEGVW